MKRSLLLGIATVFALACACALCACSSTSEEALSSASSSSAQENPFVGTWEIVSQEKVHNEDLEEEKASGRSRFFILEDDGTAKTDYLGTVTQGTYKQLSDKAAKLVIDDPTWSDEMSLEDDLLVVIGSDGLRYRFEKIDEQDYESYVAR